MRKSQIAGAAGLVVLGVVAFTASSYVIQGAPFPGPRRVADAPVPQGKDVEVPQDVAAKLGSRDQERTVLKPGVAKSSLRIVDVIDAGGGVVVEAEAVLNNGIEDRAFIWILAVTSEDNPEFSLRQRYDHQVALSRRGTILEPTFREAVPLPPGDYTVMLSVVEVPHNGLQALDDPEAAASWAMAHDGRQISVQ
jgi:hypothetical protein